MPLVTKCENKKAKYLRNLKSERFSEPRMFTMQQIRNITFAVLNQSTLNDRVTRNEKHLVKTYDTCLDLDRIDKQIRADGQVMHNQISERVTKWREEFTNL